VLKFRINQLIDLVNDGRAREDWITVQEVADAIGVPRGTLSPLTSYRRKPVTNTATVESLYRYFRRELPDDVEFGWADLLEVDPEPGPTTPVRVDELYPERANRRGQGPPRRRRRRTQ
jgi:hypothetical protein